MTERKIIGWYTKNGKHIPLFSDKKSQPIDTKTLTNQTFNLGHRMISGDESAKEEYKRLKERKIIVDAQFKLKERQIAENKKQANIAGAEKNLSKIGIEGVNKDNGFEGLLGERYYIDFQKRMEYLEKYNTINPNYLKSKEYSVNCSICTAATILQTMGYNVEARYQPSKGHYYKTRDVLTNDLSNMDNYILPSSVSEFDDRDLYKIAVMKKYFSQTSDDRPRSLRLKDADKMISDNGSYMPRGQKAATTAIANRVIKWGNGAVGELSVTWKNGGSHSVVIYNDNGVPTIFDAQCNTSTTDISKYMSSCIANNTQLVRWDNAQPKFNNPRLIQSILDTMFTVKSVSVKNTTLKDIVLGR